MMTHRPNPSDGHAYRPIVHSLESSLCLVCYEFPEDHACDFCGERKGDHTDEMHAACAKVGRVPDCYICGAKPWQAHDHLPLLPPTCDTCGGIGHTLEQHRIAFRYLPANGRKSNKPSHTEELRAMAEDLRCNAGPIGSPLYISRVSRAEAYETVAKRLEGGWPSDYSR